MPEDCSTIYEPDVASAQPCCNNSAVVKPAHTLEVDLAPAKPFALRLQNPVMPASGTFGYGVEYSQLVSLERLGAIVTKGITRVPWEGNPQPRLWETASGLLNSIGLENIGVEEAVVGRAPIWATWKVPVIVNIAGHTIDEYVQLARKLHGVPGVAALEVNISCPNVAQGGIEFGTSPEVAARITSLVRAATSLPIIVKLSPNVTDIVAIATAVTSAGADSLCVINTLRGTAIDVEKRAFRLGREAGGLSGPAIKPVALHMVHKVAHSVGIPVIGCGGITTAQDALEFIMAGATAVQVGTATFTEPRAMVSIVDDIHDFMSSHGIVNLAEIRGIL